MIGIMGDILYIFTPFASVPLCGIEIQVFVNLDSKHLGS